MYKTVYSLVRYVLYKFVAEIQVHFTKLYF